MHVNILTIVKESLNMIKTFRDFLKESPLYNDTELQTQQKIKHPLTDKSVKNLESEYNFVGDVSGYEVWFNGKMFIAGKRYEHSEHGWLFYIIMQIRTRGNTMFPTTPADIVPGVNSYQVSWAEISSDVEGIGLAKVIYLMVIDYVGSLTSDNEQYKGARRLWESLAKNVNVFVWDGNKSDYIRDEIGNKLKLKEIDPNQVWGQAPIFRNVLLVAMR